MFTTVDQVKQIVSSFLNKTGRGGFITGVVSSINPLKIKINAKLEISGDCLYVTENCFGINIDTKTFRESLKIGDGIILLSRPSTIDGTKYILLDKIRDYKSAIDITNIIPIIPSIPSSLPANGGNADTVDNHHASEFFPASGGTISGNATINGTTTMNGAATINNNAVITGTLNANGSEVLPVGTILPCYKNTADIGYILCDGSALTKSVYPRLWQYYVTYLGLSNSQTAFNTPNFKGRTIVMPDGSIYFPNLGCVIGEPTHTLTAAELASHLHDGIYWALQTGGPPVTFTGTGLQNSYAVPYTYGAGNTGDSGHKFCTAYSGSNQPHNNIQASVGCNYQIKY